MQTQPRRRRSGFSPAGLSSLPALRRGRPSPAERGGSGGAERWSRPAASALLLREVSAVPARPCPEAAAPGRSPPPRSVRLCDRALRLGFAEGRGMKLELRVFGAGQRRAVLAGRDRGSSGARRAPGARWCLGWAGALTGSGAASAARAAVAAVWPVGSRGSRRPVFAPYRSPHAAAPPASPPRPCLGPPARTRPHGPPGASFCPERLRIPRSG